MALCEFDVIEGGAAASANDRHAGARPAGPALSAWLETQARVVEFWLDRLIGEGGDPRTIAVLQTHAAFLREAGEL